MTKENAAQAELPRAGRQAQKAGYRYKRCHSYAGGYEFRPAKPEVLGREAWKVINVHDLESGSNSSLMEKRLRAARARGLT